MSRISVVDLGNCDEAIAAPFIGVDVTKDDEDEPLVIDNAWFDDGTECLVADADNLTNIGSTDGISTPVYL